MKPISILSRYIFRADAGLLFDPKTGIQHSLNATASMIIKQLLEGQSELDVAQFLANEYDVAISKAQQDIDDLLTDLVSPAETLDFLEFEKTLDSVPEFPFALELELTRLCNWNCVFCYNVWKIDEISSQSRKAIKHFDTQRLFEILRECREHGLFRVRYSGGEPTLHPDFQAILDYGASLGFYQVVFTNGHSLDMATARSWSQSNVKEVLISLHGPETVHNKLTGKRDAYQRAIAAIHNSLEAALSVVVEMTLTSENMGDVFAIIEIVKAMGVRDFRVMRYVPRGKGDTELEVSYDAISKLITQLDAQYRQRDIHIRFPCSPKFCLSDSPNPILHNEIVEHRSRYLVQHCNAGITWLSISYDGRLRVCPHSDVFLADVSEQGKSVREAWKFQLRPSVLQVLDKRRSGCDKCMGWDLCLGGCYLNLFRSSSR